MSQQVTLFIQWLSPCRISHSTYIMHLNRLLKRWQLRNASLLSMVSTECHFRNAYITHDNVECLHPWNNIQVEQAHLRQLHRAQVCLFMVSQRNNEKINNQNTNKVRKYWHTGIHNEIFRKKEWLKLLRNMN